MDILIICHEKDASSILEDAKTCFAREFPDRETEWKTANTSISTSLPITEEEVTGVFQDLVNRYPRLCVTASCSREIREDDRSAQWWVTTRIYSETENGETRIVSSSNTYWN